MFYGTYHVVLWTISVLHAGKALGGFGILCVHTLPIEVLLSSLLHSMAFFMDGLVHQLAVICRIVHGRNSCAVEDLPLVRSVRNVVNTRVCVSLGVEQIQTAGLPQECITVRMAWLV